MMVLYDGYYLFTMGMTIVAANAGRVGNIDRI